jgi:acyl-CoA synthetase (NDP forming)
VAAADACEQVGLSVPPFAAEIQEQLSQILPPAGTSIRNPIDVGVPIMPPVLIEKILEIAASVDNIDTIIATQALHYILSGRLSFLFNTSESFVQDSVQAPVKVKRRFGKPVIMVLPIGSDEVEMIDAERGRREIRATYLNEGIPVYPTLERAARAIANVTGYHQKEAEIR